MREGREGALASPLLFSEAPRSDVLLRFNRRGCFSEGVLPVTAPSALTVLSY